MQSSLICKLLSRLLVFALIRELCKPTFSVKPKHVIHRWERVLCFFPTANLLVLAQSWYSCFQTKIADKLHLFWKLSIAASQSVVQSSSSGGRCMNVPSRSGLKCSTPCLRSWISVRRPCLRCSVLVSMSPISLVARDSAHKFVFGW